MSARGKLTVLVLGEDTVDMLVLEPTVADGNDLAMRSAGARAAQALAPRAEVTARRAGASAPREDTEDGYRAPGRRLHGSGPLPSPRPRRRRSL